MHHSSLKFHHSVEENRRFCVEFISFCARVNAHLNEAGIEKKQKEKDADAVRERERERERVKSGILDNCVVPKKEDALNQMF